MSRAVGYLVGSLSARSINRQLAERVVARAPGDLVLREIVIRDLPLYNYDLEDEFPPAAAAFKRAVESVDALLFVTPEYNRSIPSAMKNALDWGSRPWGENSFAGRRAGIVGTGLNGAGTAVAQAQLRSILGYLGVSVVGAPELCIPWAEGILHAVATTRQIDAYWQAFRTELGTDSAAVGAR